VCIKDYYCTFLFADLHGCRSSVKFRGEDIFAGKIWINKMPVFYTILARKIMIMPVFFMIFTRKNARILRNNCPKNIFPEF